MTNPTAPPHLQNGLPTPQYAAAYAELAMMAGGRWWAQMLGPCGHAVMAALYLQSNTLYSSDKVIFSVVGQNVRGMINGFSHAQEQAASQATDTALFKALGWRSWRLVRGSLWFALRGVRFDGRADGDFYIQGIAVYPDSRGQGISHVLMDAMARRAQALQCRQLVLDVALDNAPAIGAYKRYGFVMMRQTPSRRPLVGRMVAEI